METDLTGLERTGKDSVSSQFQLTPDPLCIKERIRISVPRSGGFSGDFLVLKLAA